MSTAPRHRHLTKPMREALRRARSQPLRRVHKPGPGRPPWPAYHSTLTTLVNDGLLEQRDRLSRQGYLVDEWFITEFGVEALKPVIVRRDIVRLLHVAGGSTRMMQLGTWIDVRMPEPEAMRLAA